ncbi:hypothetical protein Brsp06_04662 [Brucella sp. NBRC 13694]
MVWKHARRCACRPRCGAGPHSRSHRLFNHRWRRSESRSLRLLLNRRADRLRWRSSGHDLCRDRGNRRANDHTSEETWRRIPVGGNHPRRHHPGHGRYLQTRLSDAFRIQIGHDWLCERVGNPHLLGAVAGVDQCAHAHLCPRRCGARHHLSVPVCHKGCSFASRLHHCANSAVSLVGL